MFILIDFIIEFELFILEKYDILIKIIIGLLVDIFYINGDIEVFIEEYMIVILILFEKIIL